MASLDNKPYHFNEESSKRLCDELGIEYTGPMVMSFSPELTKKLCETLNQQDPQPLNVAINVRDKLGRSKDDPFDLEGDTVSLKIIDTGHGTYLSYTEGTELKPTAEDLVPTPVLFKSPLDERFVVDPKAVIADPGLKIQNASLSGACSQQPRRLNIDDSGDVRIEMFDDEELDMAMKAMNDFSAAVTPPYARGFKLAKEPMPDDPVDQVNVHAMVEHAIRTCGRNARIMTCIEASDLLTSKQGISDHFFFIALERSMPDTLKWFNDIIKAQQLVVPKLGMDAESHHIEAWKRAALQVSKGITFFAVAPDGFKTYSDIFKWISSTVTETPKENGLVFVFSD